jgi:indolepyruvate ferredoxin oxidoreductase
VRLLTEYQNEAYAKRYRALIERVRRAEAALGKESEDLTRTVAITYAKLLAYKDEYEVGRLFSESLRRHLAESFEDGYRLHFHLAPPLLSRRDSATGRYAKRRFGPWMLQVFGLLARLKFLRGTPFDPFGHTRHRRFERKLITEYEGLVAELLATLSSAGYGEALELAGLAQKIRGFDVVKEEAAAAVGRQMQERRRPQKQAAE